MLAQYARGGRSDGVRKTWDAGTGHGVDRMRVPALLLCASSSVVTGDQRPRVLMRVSYSRMRFCVLCDVVGERGAGSIRIELSRRENR